MFQGREIINNLFALYLNPQASILFSKRGVPNSRPWPTGPRPIQNQAMWAMCKHAPRKRHLRDQRVLRAMLHSIHVPALSIHTSRALSARMGCQARKFGDCSSKLFNSIMNLEGEAILDLGWRIINIWIYWSQFLLLGFNSYYLYEKLHGTELNLKSIKVFFLLSEVCI